MYFLIYLFIILQFFTTKPYACEPSSLPKYPPSKEMDAKIRDEEARRWKIAINLYLWLYIYKICLYFISHPNQDYILLVLFHKRQSEKKEVINHMQQ